MPLIYQDRPVFGIEIGNRSAKIVQLKPGKKPRVVGYSSTSLPPEGVIEGIVADPELLAKAIKPALDHPKAGHFTSKRAVFALPAAKVFIRTLQLPPMSQSDLEQAVHFEAEQYVPVPVNDLYIDYETAATVNGPDGQPHTEVLMVAAPRAIVDSYIKLFDLLNIELAAIETSLTAVARAVAASQPSAEPVLIVDLGAKSADMAVYHRSMRVVGSVAVGGDDLTADMVKILNIKPEQANEIKYKFGLVKSDIQPKIMQAIAPRLKTIATELKKLIKFYQDRNESATINRVVLAGGGANLPGLTDYLHQELGLDVSLANPWSSLDTHLPPPTQLELAGYITAIGLAQRGSQL